MTELIKRPDGVEMYGLYAEGVQIHTNSGTARMYFRGFLVDDTIYFYRRQVSRKSTIWRKTKCANRLDARQRFIKAFEAPSPMLQIVLRGEPVVVQLKASDVLEMDKGAIPAARYIGGGRIEAAIGKFLPDVFNEATATEAAGGAS